MNFWEFFASIVDSLAWPGLILALIILAIKNYKMLSRFVSSIKYDKFEITFTSAFNDAREEAEKIAPTEASVADNILPENINRLIQSDSALAILKIWKDFESEIIKTIGITVENTPLSLSRIFDIFRLENLITTDEYRLFMLAKKIRNSSVHIHDFKPTSSEVVEFNTFTQTLLNKIKNVSSNDTRWNNFIEKLSKNNPDIFNLKQVKHTKINF